MVVKEAKKYVSDITIYGKGKSADLKRLMSVMGLGIKKNEEVVIEAVGDDSEKAITELKDFFEKNV